VTAELDLETRLGGRGPEPGSASVPQREPGAAGYQFSLADSYVGRGAKQRGHAPLEVLIVSRGTDGSNPASSSGESGTNRAAAGDIRAYEWPLRPSRSMTFWKTPPDKAT
jgi:hypothetical protein